MNTGPTAGSSEHVTPEPPAWDAADPAGSFARYAAWLSEKARITFLTDGFHTEIFFLMRADGQGGMGVPPPGMDRDQVVGMLRQSIRANDIYGVVHVCEAWTYFPKALKDHTLAQVMEGEIAVSELRPGDRTEVLTVRMESRDGASRMWMSPIARPPTGVALADAIEWPHPPGGTFVGLFGR